MSDLWHIPNPPALLALIGPLPGLVASGPDSMTLDLAVRPEEAVLEFHYIVPSQKESGPIRSGVLKFAVDHERHRLNLLREGK